MAKSSFDLPHLPSGTGDHGDKRPQAVALKLILPDDPSHTTDRIDPVEELIALADTAGVQVVATVLQRRQKPHRQTYVGKGKLEELKNVVEDLKPKMVLIDDPISPSQAKNIEDHIECQVVDRTELIMDIFATHARTAQAQLQVELAQLRYSQSRLKRMWTHLSRMEGGIGMRGPGETQLETDRRIIRKKIGVLRDRLKGIEQQARTQHKSRSNTFRIALVGYTNAGKSTLMKALTGAEVLIEDRLFATLDTCTRQWDLDSGQDVILSDTVGFIRKLPHTLVASFQATLMEVKEADLLLHVVDGHSPRAEIDVEAVEGTLADIGCENKKTITLFNKIDLLPEDLRIDIQYLLDRHDESLLISATSGTGIDALTDLILGHVRGDETLREYELPMARGDLLARLREIGTVVEERYEEDRIVISARLSAEDLRRFDVLLAKSGLN